jgi:hypothetical protein
MMALKMGKHLNETKIKKNEMGTQKSSLLNKLHSRETFLTQY